jgi:hypothetical protein
VLLNLGARAIYGGDFRPRPSSAEAYKQLPRGVLKGISSTMSTRRALSATGDIALGLLRLASASADVFPPLKNAAEGALYIAEIVAVGRIPDSQVESSH